MILLGRVVLFLITAFVLVIFYLPLGHDDYAGRWGDGTFGVTVVRGVSNVVESVTPGSRADRAGIRPHDQIVYDHPFDFSGLELSWPRAGDHRVFKLRHPDGSTYRADLVATPVDGFSAWDRWTGFLAIIPATVFLIVAFALVFIRPNVMTWSFYGVAVGYFSTGPSFQYFHAILPVPIYGLLTFFLATVFGNFSVAPLIPFVLRFPDNRLTGFSKTFDRVMWGAIVVAFLAACYSWFSIWSMGEFVPFSDVLNNWFPLAVFVLATYILVGKFKHATPQVRQRFGFLVIGLVISFLAYAVYFIPGVPFALAQVIGYAVVIMPISVAYAVLRHRVIDVNFVLNRALAYGTLSLVVIAIVSVLDWFFSRVLSEWHLAIVAELAATICVGFLLDRINKGIENVVERIFFRHRRLAELYLRRAAAALPYATEESAVSEGLVEIPAEALRLSAAALYRRTDKGRFEGVATSSQTPVAPPGFDPNHLLVRMLQADEDRVWLDELRTHLDNENSAIYVLAVPVTVRHELVSFTLYGAHANGSQLDPEEVELLEELSREAARAYDHIEAVRARERYARFTLMPETV